MMSAASGTPAFDTIVVGLGAMGSATLLQLARRGQRVLGLDRWDPPHAWGSTHGDTRITRCAIGEGEQYVPLALRSHEIWREIEAQTGADLLSQCGALILAPPRRLNTGGWPDPGFAESPARTWSGTPDGDMKGLMRTQGRPSRMQVHATQEPSRKPSSLHLLLSDRRLAAMLGLGFSSGIPFLLVYVTQSAWLSEAKVPIGILGLMSELTLAYKFKFLWAPFLDRYDAPVLGRLLGRRRGWIIASQLAVVLTLAGVAFGDPGHWLAWTVVFSLALGFAGATQDVVIDGWRITAVPAEQQALMSSWAEIGWRVGNFAAGAGALYLADRFGWRAAYLCMAALMAPGMAAALLAPEPRSEPRSDGAAPPAPLGFVATIAAPIRELLTRLGPLAVPVLVMVMVAGFRMPGYVSSAMAMPLFKALHYSNTDIATVTKLFGFWVALGGTFLASWVVPRIGMMASLLAGTVFGSASHLSLAYLAAYGGHGGGEFWVFAAAVSIDSFAYAFASIVLITYMSSLTATEHAASQYALLTSLCALPGSLLAGMSGFVIESMGFEWFFIATSLIGVPVALSCWHVRHLQERMRLQPAV